jgi:DNA-binding response OmpR family regulator
VSAAELVGKVDALQALTRYEHRVLTHLAEKHDQVVTYADAQAAMYDAQVHGHVTSNVLQVVVSRLRKKIELAKQDWKIEVERGRGYRLVPVPSTATEGGAE